MTLGLLAGLDRQQNRSEEAHQAYKEELKIYRELAQKDPKSYLPKVSKNGGRKEFESGDWKDKKDTPICSLDDLREADGMLVGSPTR